MSSRFSLKLDLTLQMKDMANADDEVERVSDEVALGTAVRGGVLEDEDVAGKTMNPYTCSIPVEIHTNNGGKSAEEEHNEEDDAFLNMRLGRQNEAGGVNAGEPKIWNQYM
ncbi:unnamed protein product [Dicrocoelium dendriticum]|nr:unnamed protein product [Dicrocoelium dendriticum]